LTEIKPRQNAANITTQAREEEGITKSDRSFSDRQLPALREHDDAEGTQSIGLEQATTCCKRSLTLLAKDANFGLPTAIIDATRSTAEIFEMPYFQAMQYVTDALAF
jgi:hypothetical protein